ncbi:hypothetical protein GWI33_004890 [Rhynchophorus ferrugineus]|uniref:Uncharacterized protein n=1 Tax=Rhynchophorus ferrugineus TaxID=354439 RepID=A0A834MF35_RHYFE|nr:hypothetical protein GWI33_004890 [Rhynchophorus ferrugineus]
MPVAKRQKRPKGHCCTSVGHGRGINWANGSRGSVPDRDGHMQVIIFAGEVLEHSLGTKIWTIKKMAVGKMDTTAN